MPDDHSPSSEGVPGFGETVKALLNTEANSDGELHSMRKFVRIRAFRLSPQKVDSKVR